MSDYCNLFSQTFYSFLFSYLTITDVISYVHHKLPVSFLLYIATKNTCQINHIITVNSSMNAPISETLSSQKNNSCTPCVPMLSIVKGKKIRAILFDNFTRRLPVLFDRITDNDLHVRLD